MSTPKYNNSEFAEITKNNDPLYSALRLYFNEDAKSVFNTNTDIAYIEYCNKILQNYIDIQLANKYKTKTGLEKALRDLYESYKTKEESEGPIMGDKADVIITTERKHGGCIESITITKNDSTGNDFIEFIEDGYDDIKITKEQLLYLLSFLGISYDLRETGKLEVD